MPEKDSAMPERSRRRSEIDEKLEGKMNNLLSIIFIFSLAFINTRSLECQTNETKQSMITLVSDIIETPTRMIEIMDNNETIDCSRIIELFKNEEWRLINFTMDITYIKCRGYVFENIYESPLAGTDDLIYAIFLKKFEYIYQLKRKT